MCDKTYIATVSYIQSEFLFPLLHDRPSRRSIRLKGFRDRKITSGKDRNISCCISVTKTLNAVVRQSWVGTVANDPVPLAALLHCSVAFAET